MISFTVEAIDPLTGEDLGVVVSGSYNLTTPKGGGGGEGNL
jgi:hypothetical protein